jgi:DNA-binding NtrC family response regulator
MLKQDTEMIQKMMISGQVPSPELNNPFPVVEQNEHGIPLPEKSMEITEDGQRMIRDDAIGDISIKNLEEEAITRSLRYFNNNRRKTAKSLGMSERTLYRKIEEFGLEPKIKRKK